MSPNPMAGQPLTPEEIKFLDEHSGTTPMAAEELATFLVEMQEARAAARIPDVPHIAEIVAALPSHYEAIEVQGFINFGRIDHPDGENTVTIRDWLEAGGDPAPVIALALQAEWLM